MHASDSLDAGPVDLLRLFNDAIDVALAKQNSQAFFEWFGRSLPAYLNEPQLAASPEACNALGATFGRGVWNAIPLPRLGFRPDTVAEPGRNDACICGSGRKYKHCCRGAPSLPPIDVHAIWPLLLPKLSDEDRNRAFAAHRVPVSALSAFAEQQVEEGQETEAIALLESCIDGAFAAADDDAAMLIDALCNAYDAADADDRKLVFLQRATQLPRPSPLRAEAWARLATIEMDAGRGDAAWAAFKQAQRDAPKMEALAYLEISLLAATERDEEARARARAEIKRLQRHADPDDPRFAFLEDVIADPQSAFDVDRFISEDDEPQSPLADWLEEIAATPLPRYDLAFEQPADLPESSGSPGTHARLVTPKALQQIESAWRKVFTLDKPISTQEGPPRDTDVWSDSHFDRWRQFLDAHPEAGDSLDILDDLATALWLHPDAEMTDFDADLRILLERSRNILIMSLAEHPRLQLCWTSIANRPALRSLHRLQGLYDRAIDEGLAMEAAKFLLALNPHDNHGMRCWLVNEHLARDENAEALAVAEPYGKDYFPETRFGRVLALHRLGRSDEAQTALASAHADLPHVVRYLIAEDIEPPELYEHGVRPAGEDQAWYYREDMRPVWTDTPGAIQRLQRFAGL